MTDPEFLLALALAESRKAKNEVALVVDNSFKILALGTGASSGCETAIANVMHGAEGRLDNTWVLATYTPTPLCLGMANILGVASVGFLDVSLNVKDAALSQDIVRLAKLPVNDVPLFSVKPKEDLPNWKTDPEKFLDAANKAFFGSLNPKIKGP